MSSLVEQWNIHPEHFWLHGKRPAKIVEYDEKLQMWNIYGYPESIEVLSRPKVFSNDSAYLSPIPIDPSICEGDFAQMDPPEHRKVRGLVDRSFTPRLVADMEPRVHRVVEELLDDIADRDRFDLVADFANPLPVLVISDLLGVPRSDRPLFKNWMHQLLDGAEELAPPETLEEMEAQLEKGFALLREMRDYWSEHAADRRRTPREDLLSHLVHAEVDGERLSDGAVFNIANRLLIAGHHTTSMLIANTMLCLEAFPDQAERVRADRSLMPGLIEESIRFLSPLSGIMRVVAEDTEVGGHHFAKDQMVMVWCGAANRDERQFADPNVFDAARSPNVHIGFGRGVHFCLGRRLARAEGRAAVDALLDRFPALRTDPDQAPTFFRVIDASGLESMPVLTR
ncbi:cytochrome P450 [Embleya sp. AB8]|uniref:cytochrome P450 n=1 Tax=Embleya sp. AB8 TaxID=3156304 RepID=UPI003C790260